MGVSHFHASTVPLVLNTSTGAITPQFHIVFDDWFATVSANHNEIPDFSSKEWNKMFGNSTYQYIMDEPTEQEGEFTDLIDTINSEIKSNQISQSQDNVDPPQPLDVEQPATSADVDNGNHTPTKSTTQSNDLTLHEPASAAPDTTTVASKINDITNTNKATNCLLYTSPSPRDRTRSRMPSSA